MANAFMGDTAPNNFILLVLCLDRSTVSTHYTSMPERSNTQKLNVIISDRPETCNECNQSIERGDLISRNGSNKYNCLSCADLDHLVFLRAGQMALTRRASTYSSRFAVVEKFSRARRRYERQGTLVEEAALHKAEAECLSDADVRAQRQERDSARLARHDQEYISQFASKIRELFPGAAEGVEYTIAHHACEKHSGRVGRSANAKQFDEQVIVLAVRAHVRHGLTRYDSLLNSGMDRNEARLQIHPQVDSIVEGWRNSASKDGCQLP